MGSSKKPNFPLLKCLLALAYLALCLYLNRGVSAQAPARPTAQMTAQAAVQGPLTAREVHGKKIYTQGVSPSGKDILAYIGESSLEMPGSAIPCANCHGLDGKGKPEGGVVPSNLTWEELTKPYGVAHTDGRQHPPYTERGLELAITRGFDPAGHRLLNVMPRYVMSKEDLADLILYLKRLGEDRDPGISDSKIVIGTTIPGGALAGTGAAIKASLSAFFDDLNSKGGIYNRRVELKFLELPETPEARRASVEHLLTDGQVFALTGAFVAGAEKEVIPLLAENEVPLIGPITFYPQTEAPLNRQVFYVLSGVDGQARALVDFAARKGGITPDGNSKVSGSAVVYAQGDLNEGVVKAIKDQAQKDKLGSFPVYNYKPGGLNADEMVKQLRQAERETIFFLGSNDELLALMREADRQKWYPAILQPSAGGGADIFDAPIGFNDKLYFASPTSLSDQSEKGRQEFSALAEKYRLPRQHLAVQFSVYSAAKILVEALRRVGKDVSREKLIQALEGFYQYPTELTPAITYGPNRRIGAMGAYVVQVNLQLKALRPASNWIDIN